MQPYWVNTSDNLLIKNLLKKSSIEFKESFEILMNGRPISRIIDERLLFSYLDRNPTAAWSLFLASGYLKVLSSVQTPQGLLCELAIPNREVANLYREIIEQWLSNGYGIEWYNQFIESLLSGDVNTFKMSLAKVLLQITSYHDLAIEPEAFFHGLLLGITANLHGSGTYEIKSNRESAKGRFDILLIPKDIKRLGIILELKNTKNEKLSLVKLAQEAIEQIDHNGYLEEFKIRHIPKVQKFGIGFRGKMCEVIGEEEMIEIF